MSEPQQRTDDETRKRRELKSLRNPTTGDQPADTGGGEPEEVSSTSDAAAIDTDAGTDASADAETKDSDRVLGEARRQLNGAESAADARQNLSEQIKQLSRQLASVQQERESTQQDIDGVHETLDALEHIPDDEPFGVQFTGAIVPSPPYPRDLAIEKYEDALDELETSLNEYDETIDSLEDTITFAEQVSEKLREIQTVTE